MGRGKQRQPTADGESWIPRSIVVAVLGVFGLVGLTMLVAAGLTASDVKALLDRERVVRGRVVDVQERYNADDEPYRAFVVEFLLPNEEPQRVDISGSSNPPAYAIGDTVNIRYDPLSPDRGGPDTPDHAAVAWLMPVMLGVVGAGFLAGLVRSLFVVRDMWGHNL